MQSGSPKWFPISIRVRFLSPCPNRLSWPGHLPTLRESLSRAQASFHRSGSSPGLKDPQSLERQILAHVSTRGQGHHLHEASPSFLPSGPSLKSSQPPAPTRILYPRTHKATDLETRTLSLSFVSSPIQPRTCHQKAPGHLPIASVVPLLSTFCNKLQGRIR